MSGDLLLNENDELMIHNGDFLVGDAEAQHVDLLIHSFKGEFKETPILGAEAQKLIKQRQTTVKIKREVNEQLSWDGYQNIEITIEQGNLTINAERNT